MHKTLSIPPLFGLCLGPLAPTPEIGSRLQVLVCDHTLPPNEANADCVEHLVCTPQGHYCLGDRQCPVKRPRQPVLSSEVRPNPETERHDRSKGGLLALYGPLLQQMHPQGDALSAPNLQLRCELAPRHQEPPRPDARGDSLGVLRGRPADHDVLREMLPTVGGLPEGLLQRSLRGNCPGREARGEHTDGADSLCVQGVALVPSCLDGETPGLAVGGDRRRPLVQHEAQLDGFPGALHSSGCPPESLLSA
mmetsp:Transcript_109737/g.274934  ORF Transcript_109737/g.274934 Transcript_109737/m.274934 type:complete len:250 (+) Transcript_109737:1679-2428(+)